MKSNLLAFGAAATLIVLGVLAYQAAHPEPEPELKCLTEDDLLPNVTIERVWDEGEMALLKRQNPGEAAECIQVWCAGRAHAYVPCP